MDLSALLWRKSSYSGGGGNNCAEVAAHHGFVAVRDSKAPGGPALVLNAGAFRDLTARIKHGDYDN
jgi:hypothetical protein